MSDDLDQYLQKSLSEGERVALATVVSGPGAGRRLLVWSAGQTYGHLGWPHVNQRVALYAEQLFERAPASTTKSFDVPGEGAVSIRIEFPRSA